MGKNFHMVERVAKKRELIYHQLRLRGPKTISQFKEMFLSTWLTWNVD
jgi:hypothetical protein